MDYKSLREEYNNRVGKIPINQLTIEDKKIVFEYHLQEAIDNFQTALFTADELDYTYYERLMSEAKSMVFDVEDKGIDIGSMD